MQTLLVFHNLIRWLILIFAFWTVISAIMGVVAKKEYSAGDGRSNFFFMLGMDIQLLIGLILYFSGVWFDRLKDFSVSMKDPTLRFFTMEHGVMMIIAWILVHAGRISVKKAPTSQAKFKKTLIYFGIALLIILFATPWPFREAIGRPWYRWF
jgi:cell division protein FtsW (lipid II flippase)